MKSGAVYWACHTLIWVNLAFYISVVFLLIFKCHPISEAWSGFRGSHCIHKTLALVFSAAVNVFSDLLNLLLPIWAIWHLQMAPRRKFGVTAVFATGFLYCLPFTFPNPWNSVSQSANAVANNTSNRAFAASICRLIYCIQLLYNDDVTYILAQIGLWTYVLTFHSFALKSCLHFLPYQTCRICEYHPLHLLPVDASSGQIDCRPPR